MHKATVVPVIVSTLMLSGFLDSATAQDVHQHLASRDGDAVALSAELASLLSIEMLAIESGLNHVYAKAVPSVSAAGQTNNNQVVSKPKKRKVVWWLVQVLY